MWYPHAVLAELWYPHAVLAELWLYGVAQYIYVGPAPAAAPHGGGLSRHAATRAGPPPSVNFPHGGAHPPATPLTTC